MAHFDEIHIDQQAKHVSSDGNQIRFRRDKNGKVMQPLQSGGSYRELATETTFKYAKDACFCLSVAKVCLLNSDGKEYYEGRRCQTFDYTGKCLLSISDYKKMDDEV